MPTYTHFSCFTWTTGKYMKKEFICLTQMFTCSWQVITVRHCMSIQKLWSNKLILANTLTLSMYACSQTVFFLCTLFFFVYLPPSRSHSYFLSLLAVVKEYNIIILTDKYQHASEWWHAAEGPQIGQVFFVCQNNEVWSNVEQAVRLLFQLEGVEGDLSLRHCLHLYVNCCIWLCQFNKVHGEKI